MTRINLVLDTVCFRLFILNLRKWMLEGGVGARPTFERFIPTDNSYEALSRLTAISESLQSLELEVAILQERYDTERSTSDTEEAIIISARQLDIVDVYGFNSPLDVLFSMYCPHLLHVDRLPQALNHFRVCRVINNESADANESGYITTRHGVNYYTDMVLPESQRFVPKGYVILEMHK